MYAASQDDYLKSRVLTADPIALVGILYEGLEEAIGEARRSLARGDIRNRSRSITQAIAIIGELSAGLDQTADASYAQVNRLYEYMIWLLTQANVSQTDPPLAEVERLASTIASAWRSIAGGVSTVAMPAPAEPEFAVHVSCLG